MTEFNVGDVVYIKDEVVERFKKYSELAGSGLSSASRQIGLAKDLSFTIIYIDPYGTCYLTNFNDNWGTDKTFGLWKGQKYKTWAFSPCNLEKRIDLNTVSLFELNRGL